MNWVRFFFYKHKTLISAVKNADRISYIILRGRWFHIIVLNVPSLTEDKTDDVKNSDHSLVVEKGQTKRE
jgi:hypothetical protein